MAVTRLLSIGKLARLLGENESVIRHLANQGVISSERTPGGHRRFDPTIAIGEFKAHQAQGVQGASRWAAGAASVSSGAPSSTDRTPDFESSHLLAGLAEHDVWELVKPNLGIPSREVERIANYAISEMVNNAIDHSEGRDVRVSVWRLPHRVRVRIQDDGIGVFDRVKVGWNLPDLHAAAAELTKGKRTTAPAQHSGEGIFFTSKAVSKFRLESNGLAWVVDNDRIDQALGPSQVTRGTVVTIEIDLATQLTLGDLFRQFSDDGEFIRSRPVVKLFQSGREFLSRSEAKRLLAGMREFRDIDVDFTDVEFVGQAFVDEMFRVWPSTTPGTAIHPLNMSSEVEFMVNRGLPHDAPG